MEFITSISSDPQWSLSRLKQKIVNYHYPWEDESHLIIFLMANAQVGNEYNVKQGVFAFFVIISAQHLARKILYSCVLFLFFLDIYK